MGVKPNMRSCSQLVAGMALVLNASAQTISGAYNDTTGDGYDLTAPDPVVLVADDAEFVNDSGHGLYVSSPTSPVALTVGSGVPGAGPTFYFNEGSGLLVLASGSASDAVVVNSGYFSTNALDGIDVYGASLTVNGGNFVLNGAYGLEAHGATVVNGGSFQLNKLFNVIGFAGSTITLNGGTFVRGTETDIGTYGRVYVYGSFDQYGPLTGSGSFTGVLKNEAVAQTLTYTTYGDGEIILVNSAVPEPSDLALVFAGLGCVFMASRMKARA